MRSGQLFWGFLFITLGALILLAKMDIFAFEWYYTWEVWPILLILWGLFIINKKSSIKPLLAILFGIITGLIVYSSLNNIFTFHYFDSDFDSHIERSYGKQNYEVDYSDNIDKAVLRMEVGAGKFIVRRTSDALLDGYSRGIYSDYDFDSVIKDNVAYLDFENKRKHFNLFTDDIRNRLELRLNDKPIWDMNLKIGAAKAVFELEDFKVENLDLATGATDIDLRLGDKLKRTDVDIEMGAANLKIKIPEESGCRLSGEMFLFSKNFDGFYKTEDGYYETTNYENADNKIFIKVKGAVSHIEVKRY